MNKDEILEKARKENKGIDEVQRSVEKDAAKIAMAVSFLVCMLFYWADFYILKTELVGPTCLIIHCVLVAAYMWVFAIRLKKALYFIGASFLSSVAAMLTVCFYLVPLYLGL